MCTLVLGPSQELFCGKDVEFRYSAIFALIKPDLNNIFLFSLTVFVFPLFKCYAYVFRPPYPRINHWEPPPSPTSSCSPSASAVILSSNPLSLSSSACDLATPLVTPATFPGAPLQLCPAPPLFPALRLNFRGSLSVVGGLVCAQALLRNNMAL